MDPNVPNKTFSTTRHYWQKHFFKSFDQGKARFSMLPWHRRARKSTMMINLLIREAMTKKRQIYTYVAPTYKQAKAIIWRNPNMLFYWLPDKKVCNWQKNESELFIEFPNNSILQVKGADEPDSLRGLDSHGVVFDEWALMKEEIWLEIFRPIIAEDPSRWASFIFTPKGQNFAFTMWQKAMANEDWYTSLLAADKSKLIPADELEMARREMPQAIFDQEFFCRFVTEEECTLITSAALERLSKVDKAICEGKKIISCDPATGGDECVIYVMEDTKIVEQKIVHHTDTMKIVGELLITSMDHGIDSFIIDSIGVGKGIVDRLDEMGKDVYAFNSAEAKTIAEPNRFRNRKSEAWWYARELVHNYDCFYPEDVELRRQISSVKYKLADSSGKLNLEPKIKTKQTLGCSPDRADAWVMGLYGLQHIEPKQPRRFLYKGDQDESESLMEMSI